MNVGRGFFCGTAFLAIIGIANPSLVVNKASAAKNDNFVPYDKTAGKAYRDLPTAKKGGTIYFRTLDNPKTINPLLTDDVEYKNILNFIFAPLMGYDYDTNQYFPLLAEKLEVSKDHKIMTYTLRKDATWEDGSPVTADDAEFTFQKMMDPKVDAAPMRSYFEGYKLEKIDPYTFRFVVEHPNVSSIDEVNSDFRLIQKKQYDGVADFNKAKAAVQPIGNGAYRLKSFSRDEKLELERIKNWWGYKLPEQKNLNNFDNIVIRIIPDTALTYEKFIKGDIDVLEMNAEMFGTRVRGSDKDKFGTGPDSDKEMWASHFKSSAPAQWTYVGWNEKIPMFQSKKTRQALAQLIDYDQVIDKVYHKEGIRCISPFGSESPNTAPDQKKHMFNLDSAKAIALLKEDGWADTDGTNTISKMIDGKKTKFEFSLRYNSENPMRAKIAQMVKENFKKAGITVNVQAIEFNTLITQMDNRDYDAVVMGWGKGNVNANTTQLWHSKSALNKGSNFTSYSNPEADKMMDKIDTVLDPKERFKLVQKLGAIIYEDQPYAFVVEIPGFMAAYHKKLQAKKWAMKYEDMPPIWMFSARD